METIKEEVYALPFLLPSTACMKLNQY